VGGVGRERREAFGIPDFLGIDPTVTEAQALVEQLLELQKARRASRRREAELAEVIIKKAGRRHGDQPSDLLVL